MALPCSFMKTRALIEELLQANYEALPLVDRLGAADALSRLYRYVVDNGQDEYCTREEILESGDRLYTSLLMAYTSATTYRQKADILLAIGTVVFGLQGVPNRRRVDHLSNISYKLIRDYLAVRPSEGETQMLRVAYLYQYSGGLADGVVRDFLEAHPEELPEAKPLQHRYTALMQWIERAEKEIQSFVWV